MHGIKKKLKKKEDKSCTKITTGITYKVLLAEVYTVLVPEVQVIHLSR